LPYIHAVPPAAERVGSLGHSVLIEFVNTDKRVTSTLLMENGKQVWTHMEAEEGEQDDESVLRRLRRLESAG